MTNNEYVNADLWLKLTTFRRDGTNGNNFDASDLSFKLNCRFSRVALLTCLFVLT